MTLLGLRSLLAEDYELAGSASEAETAIEMILETEPDLVLLDVHFPGGGGAYVVDRVRALLPEMKFLAFTVSTSAEDVVGLMRAGVNGYVVKTTEPHELREHIEDVLAGGIKVSRYVAGHLLRIDEVAAASELDSLTKRERDVVRYIARGFTYREVAAELGISSKTIESHMEHIFTKLGVASRSEVMRIAFETGFVRPGTFD